IFSNGRLGIFLGFDNTAAPPVPLVNDSKEHPGVNNSYQNYPVLNAPQTGGGVTVLSGVLSSPNNPGDTFRIEFFSNTTKDPVGPSPNGQGQGETFLGATAMTTGPNGFGIFSLTLPTALGSGLFISATATDSSGNTSEFSVNVVS